MIVKNYLLFSLICCLVFSGLSVFFNLLRLLFPQELKH